MAKNLHRKITKRVQLKLHAHIVYAIQKSKNYGD